MNDKTKIYISLLPLIVIVLLVLGAGYFLLADEIKLPNFNKGPQIRRITGFPTIVTVSETTTSDKQRLEITSEQQLDTFLNSVDRSGMLTMRDKIDFTKEYLIAVSSSVEKQDGHRIKIKKVYEDKTNKTLIASVVETYPGDTCPADISSHIAVDIVAVNKTDWKIDFERAKEVDECSSSQSSGTNP